MDSVPQPPLFRYPRICKFCGQERDPDDFVQVGQKTGRCSECRKEHNRTAHNRRGHGEVQRVKDEVFAAYGSECVYCGEQDRQLLEIDHIDGDGYEHRKALGYKASTTRNSFVVYRWLRQHNYPDGFQVLCRPCNAAKGKGSEDEFKRWVVRVCRHLNLDV